MAKKYQNRDELLKQALAQNPERAVLVVDDRLIRQKYFAEANEIIIKIERLENKIEMFHTTDQVQFEAWYSLTFREDLLSVERTQNEYRKMIEFHNWVVAAARMLNIDLSEALILMQEEEHRFKNGNQADMDRIVQERQKRNAFIDADSNAKYDEEVHSQNGPTEAETEAFDAIFDRLEEILLSVDYEILSTPELRFARIAKIDAEVLELVLEDQQTAFLLFHLGVSWGERKQDYTFFLKIWRLFSKDQKIYFAEVYESISGQSIFLLLKRIGKEANLNFDSEEVDDPEPDDQEGGFKDEFFQKDGSVRKNKTSQSPLEVESLKQLYRKLVRKLHPDAQDSNKVQGWMKRFWQSVQDAYKIKDLDALERILKLTLLRTNSLNQLTFDEIGQAKIWLQKDLSELQGQQGKLKKSLAWGFTDKKDYTALSRKIRKEFEDARNTILIEIHKIKKQHQMLRDMGTGMPRRKARKNKNRRRNQRGSFNG